MIRIDNLTYVYPNSRIPALEQVSWRVSEGEFVLVAGASGSGKSTLLRCLNGLVPHFSGGTIEGTVNVNGIDAIAEGPNRLSRVVGFVSQNPEAQAVVDQVEGEVAFALENAGVRPAEMRVRVEEALDLLDLTSLRARSIRDLSGGERQRLAIAAALALRPSILVLDEPTSQLDPLSAEGILRALVRLNEDLGLTVILAEHRLERIIRYVDRVTYLEAGRVRVDAPVREALDDMPVVPPLVELARSLEWRPLPLTVREAKSFIRGGPGPDVSDTQGQNQGYVRQIRHDSPPALRVDRLSFAYNGHDALSEVSLTVAPGEVVALMGRNGAGKSTLLKCIVGLLSARSGTILVGEEPTIGRDVAAVCRHVAYLPQHPDDLLFADSVREELAVTLRNHDMADADGIDGLLQRLGLTGLADAYPRDLSTGQRQRVALGAVTVTRPPLLLLDEPTRGLDAAAKQALVALWRGWLDDGAGLLLVTHDVELVALIADRVVVLSQGEVIADGATYEVLSSTPHFAPQIARLFPGRGWLTPADALAGLGMTNPNPQTLREN